MHESDPPLSATNEIMFTRRVVCAMIEQAVWDSRSSKGHKRAYLQNIESQNRQEANYFLSSPALDFLCSVLGLPCDKIRRSVGLKPNGGGAQ